MASTVNIHEAKTHLFRLLALHVQTLPGHCRDPLDRLLVSQSSPEGLPVLGAGLQPSRYPAEVLW